MCIIIAAPKSAIIPDAQLRRAYTSNPDGWGIAAKVARGRIEIVRGFKTEDLVDAYHEYKGHASIVVHARIATSGDIDFDNTHPYVLPQYGVLFHNGILRDVAETNPTKSDTWHYAGELTAVLNGNALGLSAPEINKAIEARAVKNASRFVIMALAQPTRIYNEKSGIWDNKIWYSNTSAFPYVAKPTTKIISCSGSTLPNVKTIVADALAAKPKSKSQAETRAERKARRRLNLVRQKV